MPEAPAKLRSAIVTRAVVDHHIRMHQHATTGGKQWIARYQADEAQRTGIPSLKVGFNSVFGYYLEITNTRPNRWTFLARDRYAVCPNCAERVAVGQPPTRMRCGKCRGVFEMEAVREAVATA